MNKQPKAIYLKSVFKDFKSDNKVGKLIKDFNSFEWLNNETCSET